MWNLSTEIQPNYDGGLMRAKHLKGGFRTVNTKSQRNAIPYLSRFLDITESTICFVESESKLYRLISNPLGVTIDSDWEVIVLGGISTFTPVGTWDSNNTAPVLTDGGATSRNGEFYFVVNTPTPVNVTNPNLFFGVTTTVVNGNMVVSVGSHWVVVANNTTWASLDKPSVITDYVNGIVQAHTHVTSEITDLNTYMNAFLRHTDVTDDTVAFSTVLDAKIPDVGFLRHWYYTSAQIDDIISHLSGGGGGPILVNGSGLTFSTNHYNLGGTLTGDVAIDGFFNVYFGTGTTLNNFGVIANHISIIAYGPNTDGLLGSSNPLGGGASFTVKNNIANTKSWLSIINSDPAGAHSIELRLDIENDQGIPGAQFIDTRATKRGIEYNATGYVTQLHSLTDKEYVLSAKTYAAKQTFIQTTTNSPLNLVGFASDPSVPLEGELSYNTTSHLLKFYNGTSWISAGGGGMTNPMTSVGDIIQGTTAGAPSRLASVAAGGVLLTGGVTTANTWGTVSNGLTSTATTFKWGGALTAATNIDGAFDVGFGQLTKLTSFGVTADGIGLTSIASPNVSLTINTDVTINMAGGGFLVNGDTGVSRLIVGSTGIIQMFPTTMIITFGSDAIGDIYQRNASGNFSRLASVATGNALISGGVATVSSWGKITSAHIDATVQTAGLSWLLASGGTLTGVNTITSNAKNQLNFTGTWTATAAADSHMAFGGTLTAASALGVTGYLFNPTLNALGTSSVQVAVDINPTFAGGTTPVNIGLRVKNGGVILGNFSAFETPASPEYLLIRNDSGTLGTSVVVRNATSGAAGQASISLRGPTVNLDMGSTSAGFTTSGLKQSSTSYIVSNIQLNIGSSASPLALWSNNTERARVLTTGEFSIGATTATAKLYVFQAGLSSSWLPTLALSPGPHTSMTANAEFIDYDFKTRTATWLAGTTATQRFAYFRGQTVAGASASATFTDLYTVYIDPSIQGSQAIITNNWALGLGGGLKLFAGTTTRPALILPAGTNLSTTQAGALENDGTHLYFTFANAGTRFQLDQQSGGITVGTTIITSGTSTRVPFNNGGVYSEDAGLTYNATNDALTVGVARIHTQGAADNVFIGSGSGNFTMSGALRNVGFGTQTLRDLTSGDDNVAIGYNSLVLLTTGSLNISMMGMTNGIVTGTSNVAIGGSSLQILTSGSNNIGIGSAAGSNLTTGTNNIIIGGNSINIQSAATDNQLVIQNAIFGTNNSGTGSTASTGQIGIMIAAPLSTLDVAGSLGTNTRTITTSATLAATDHTVLGDATGGVVAATLPTASGAKGRIYVIKKIDASANNVTVATVDGGTKTISVRYSGYMVQSDGSLWYVIASF